MWFRRNCERDGHYKQTETRQIYMHPSVLRGVADEMTETRWVCRGFFCGRKGPWAFIEETREPKNK